MLRQVVTRCSSAALHATVQKQDLGANLSAKYRSNEPMTAMLHALGWCYAKSSMVAGSRSNQQHSARSCAVDGGCSIATATSRSSGARMQN